MTMHPGDDLTTPDEGQESIDRQRLDWLERQYTDALRCMAAILHTSGGKVVLTERDLLLAEPRIMRTDDQQAGTITFYAQPTRG